MSTVASLQNTAAKSQLEINSSHVGVLFQPKCAYGSPTSSLAGKCKACNKKQLQTKLSIGASNDPLEQEADRVADRVLAAPTNPTICGAAPRIQRFTGQAIGDAGTAPTSVDRVLSGSGRPLDLTLQQDMARRFGYDFSLVRVHTDSAAEQSARDVNAHAYTMGHNIVFGAGRFSPESHEGRLLLAHELAHVMQQSDSDGSSVAHSNGKRDLSPILRNLTQARQRGVMNLLLRKENNYGTESRLASGVTTLGCDITAPADLDTQRLAGVIFSEASSTAVNNNEREAIGQVFLNRVFHVDVLCSGLLGCNHTEKTRYKQCMRDAMDFGTTILKAIQRGSTAYGNKRWNMVMRGEALKPVADLCKLAPSEIIALSHATAAAEAAVQAGGFEGLMAFNKDGPPSGNRMQETKVIGPHHFHKFKPGRECG